MTSITVLVRWREPDGTRVPVYAKRLRVVGTGDRSVRMVDYPDHPGDDKTLAERVFKFLEQRCA